MKKPFFLFVILLFLFTLNSCLIMVNDDSCVKNFKGKTLNNSTVEKYLACNEKNLIKDKE